MLAPPVLLFVGGPVLLIDADRQLCSMLWRGHVALRHLEDASRMKVCVGLELPNLPIPWQHAEALSRSTPAQDGNETVAVHIAAKDLPAPLPFGPGSPGSLPATLGADRGGRANDGGSGDAVEVRLRPGEVRPVMPFAGAQRETAAVASRDEGGSEAASPGAALEANETVEVRLLAKDLKAPLPFVAGAGDMPPTITNRPASSLADDSSSGETVELRIRPEMLARPLPFGDDAAKAPAPAIAAAVPPSRLDPTAVPGAVPPSRLDPIAVPGAVPPSRLDPIAVPGTLVRAIPMSFVLDEAKTRARLKPQTPA